MRIVDLVHPGITEGEWRAKRWHGRHNCAQVPCPVCSHHLLKKREGPPRPLNECCKLGGIHYIGCPNDPAYSRAFRPPPPVPE